MPSDVYSTVSCLFQLAVLSGVFVLFCLLSNPCDHVIIDIPVYLANGAISHVL